MTFDEAKNAWEQAQENYTKAREAYRFAWAAFFVKHEGTKPESARKALTDLSTSELRAHRDAAEIAASAAWQTLLVARGPMDYSRQPGQHFGDDA